ncbi:hypothetical protein PFISCL1PPCAC_16771, partial [Pristionchus fissidentatus]
RGRDGTGWGRGVAGTTGSRHEGYGSVTGVREEVVVRVSGHVVGCDHLAGEPSTVERVDTLVGDSRRATLDIHVALLRCLVDVDVEGAAVLRALLDHILPDVLCPSGLVLLRRVEHVGQHEALRRDRRTHFSSGCGRGGHLDSARRGQLGHQLHATALTERDASLQSRNRLHVGATNGRDGGARVIVVHECDPDGSAGKFESVELLHRLLRVFGVAERSNRGSGALARRVLHNLHLLDPSEWVEDAGEHVLVNVGMQGRHREAHRLRLVSGGSESDHTGGDGVGGAVPLRARALNDERRVEQFLAVEGESERDTLLLPELYIRDALQLAPSGARVGDDAHVAHVAHRGEELLQVTRTCLTGYLQNEQRPLVSLLRRHVQVGVARRRLARRERHHVATLRPGQTTASATAGTASSKGRRSAPSSLVSATVIATRRPRAAAVAVDTITRSAPSSVSVPVSSVPRATAATLVTVARTRSSPFLAAAALAVPARAALSLPVTRTT